MIITQLNVTARSQYTMRHATGPNREGKDYEVIDADGDRVAYVDSAEEASDILHDLHNDSGVYYDRVTVTKQDSGVGFHRRVTV